MDFLSLRRASVGARLAVLSCVLVALIFATFTWALTRSAGKQVRDQVLERIAEKDRSIAAMITLFDKALSAEVDRSMSLFASFLPTGYTLDDTQKVDINGVATPTLKAGDKVLNMDFTIPDQFLERSGAVATVFARSGDDFVRVTTSLKKQDGTRAIGTLLDRKAPAYALLLANQSYTGLAALFGKRLITQYRPITDASGRVIGALFVGVNVDQEIQSVEDGIRNLKIGDSGYYFVRRRVEGRGSRQADRPSGRRRPESRRRERAVSADAGDETGRTRLPFRRRHAQRARRARQVRVVRHRAAMAMAGRRHRAARRSDGRGHQDPQSVPAARLRAGRRVRGRCS